MPREPEPFGVDYLVDLGRSYEGEVAGETYFATLATWHDGPGREVLEHFAAVERITAAALRPLMVRHGLALADVDALRERGVANALAERSIAWDDLIVEMCEFYPRYVHEFEQMLAITPADDRPAVQLLLDHEVALVAAAVGIRAGRADALAPVEQFISTASSSPR